MLYLSILHVWFQSEREKLERQLSTEGKMVIDLNDPNHPRFTLTELRDVLHERNELKTKVTTLEEELQQYKPEYFLLSFFLSVWLAFLTVSAISVSLWITAEFCFW